MEGQVRPNPVTHVGTGWIVSPAFDLLFLANLSWLLLLIPDLTGPTGIAPVTFWQIYFLTMPHRWITLFLVLADPDRREGRGKLLFGLALTAGLVVLTVHFWTGTFLCLALIDYIWNAWHFAAQHYGVLRMYTRKVGGGWAFLEKYGLRLFVFYAIALTAGWTTGWLEAHTAWREPIMAAGYSILAIPATLLLTSGFWDRRRLGKTAYLTSVCLLYSLLLIGIQENHRVLVIALTTAASLFHAVEYLAVVSHYAIRRRTMGSKGAFQSMARNWVRILAVYLICLGLFGASIELGAMPDWWAGLNLAMAFVHYTFDGMIWKLRRPATAQALGVA